MPTSKPFLCIPFCSHPISSMIQVASGRRDFLVTNFFNNFVCNQSFCWHCSMFSLDRISLGIKMPCRPVANSQLFLLTPFPFPRFAPECHKRESGKDDYDRRKSSALEVVQLLEGSTWFTTKPKHPLASTSPPTHYLLTWSWLWWEDNLRGWRVWSCG